MRRGGRAARVAVAGLTGSAMRLAVAGGDTDSAAAELADQAASHAGELVGASRPPVSAVELLGRAEALYRRTDPADLDYRQRMTAAALLSAAADRTTSQ